MSLKMDNIVYGRCSVSKIAQFIRCIFKKNINICCNLQLEIALAIPPLIDEKNNRKDSTG